MMDDFGEKLMHNKGKNVRKGKLNVTTFKRRFKFVHVYTLTFIHVNMYKVPGLVQ